MSAINDPVAGNRRLGADRRKFDDAPYEGVERRTATDCRSREAVTIPENLLEPENTDHALRLSVVLSRINDEFAYVETDEEIGQLHVEQMIDGITSQVGSRNGVGQNERLRHLKEARTQAIYVRFGDNPTSETEYLSTVLIPGEPIKVNYESARHEEDSRLLLRRFATALGYRVAPEASHDS